MEYKNYKEGLDMTQFEKNHIKEISRYNRNYYVGLNDDLLFAASDDDNETNWYLIENIKVIYLGLSTVENNLLQIFDEVPY